jgi:hypothetical protein
MNVRSGPGVDKHKFTPYEDDLLQEAVEIYGHRDWAEVARHVPYGTPRQCRERWMNYVNPLLQIRAWTPEEDALLDRKVAELGGNWVVIVTFFSNRSTNSVKNRFYAKRMPNSLRALKITPPNPVGPDLGSRDPTFDQPAQAVSESLFRDPALDDYLWDQFNL